MLRLMIAASFLVVITTQQSPSLSAEFRKSPARREAPASKLRRTPDLGSDNGDINTDPAMTNSTTQGKQGNETGKDCRTGRGQSYPNANADNPPGFQPCPD
jgi:hypothetical protein